MNAYDPGKEIVDYAATKGAIMIFTKGLAQQLAPKGIRVNAVAPGPVWTVLRHWGTAARQDSRIRSGHPMGRPGQAATQRSLRRLYVLLASTEPSFSTGQVFGTVGGHGGL